MPCSESLKSFRSFKFRWNLQKIFFHKAWNKKKSLNNFSNNVKTLGNSALTGITQRTFLSAFKPILLERTAWLSIRLTNAVSRLHLLTLNMRFMLIEESHSEKENKPHWRLLLANAICQLRELCAAFYKLWNTSKSTPADLFLPFCVFFLICINLNVFFAIYLRCLPFRIRFRSSNEWIIQQRFFLLITISCRGRTGGERMMIPRNVSKFIQLILPSSALVSSSPSFSNYF